VKGIRRLLMIHGISGTLKLLFAVLLGIALYYTPARRRARAALRDQDLEFDRKWGVDTSGKLVPEAADVVGANWDHGCRYQAVCADSLEQTLSELSLDLHQFTFLDFGSGKGRAVLAASQLPFRRVIGVEYSQSLDQVAKRNLKIFPQFARKCRDVELVCADATQFPIPSGPLILFVNNSFGTAIIAEVVKNLEASFQREPRRIVVLYFNAFFAAGWQQCPMLTEVKATRAVSIYDSMYSGAAAKAA